MCMCNEKIFSSLVQPSGSGMLEWVRADVIFGFQQYEKDFINQLMKYGAINEIQFQPKNTPEITTGLGIVGVSGFPSCFIKLLCSV